MLNVDRFTHLSSHMKQLLTPDSIVSNPAFCSLLTVDGAIPLSTFLTDFTFARQRVSPMEITAICANLRLKFIGEIGRAHV
jgi:hypothetical protein